jgi:transcriptional regulator with XRE-family HTH domain
MTSILITNDMLSLYEKEFTRQEIATELNVSLRTVSRYLIFGSQYIPDLEVYVDSSGYLNRKRVESCHVEYLREIADEAIASLGNVSQVAAKVVETTAQAGKTVGDIAQTIKPSGYQNGFQSSSLTHKSDVYGGLAFPVQDFSGMIPSDLLNPQIELQATDEQLTTGLSVYAGASRAQELLQAGFKYIQEVGQTRQQYHKAEQSIIKGATEGIKTQQEIVNFDIANVNLSTTHEKLIQARVTTKAYQNETELMRLFFEAKEQKKTAEIQRLQAESQKITQTYLKGRVPV